MDISLGYTDIHAYIMVGPTEELLVEAKLLRFGGGLKRFSYSAEVVWNEPKPISGYRLEGVYVGWLKIFDMVGKMVHLCGDEIRVYRQGQYGCLVQVTKQMSEGGNG